jgi:threonine synthase
MASNTIRYVSTQRGPAGEAAASPTSFAEALRRGQAPDGGLYVPEYFPSLDLSALAALRDAPYARVACEVLKPFVEGLVPEEAFLQLCEAAYNFETVLEPLEEDVWLLRLDRGPTASFKDYAARWMARMMGALRPRDAEAQTVLVATSGDTGSAVGEAFRGMDGFRVILLYPESEVSPVQKQQMDRIGGNVRALAMAGTFDACQALVKRAFRDPALTALNLTSANSINIGRILPQCVYYVYAWLRVSRGGPVTFVVPSGNFGNAFGCEGARRMGLPVARLIPAVNANDAFPRFLESGTYRPVTPSRACLSNAMNVGNPSNLARFFDGYGGRLSSDGVVQKAPDLPAMRRAMKTLSISDEETLACIRETWNRSRILLDPHGAVGVAALRRLGQGVGPAICLETAHPAKFSEVIRQALGFDPPLPDSLRLLKDRPEAVARLPADYETLRDNLLRSI